MLIGNSKRRNILTELFTSHWKSIMHPVYAGDGRIAKPSSVAQMTDTQCALTGTVFRKEPGSIHR